LCPSGAVDQERERLMREEGITILLCGARFWWSGVDHDS
jgi:hypothetical protein